MSDVNARRTRARIAIAAELLRRRDSAHYGYELSRNSGIGAGSMYPFLSELQEAGYLTDGWDGGKRPRRYYHLTDEGEHYLQAFLGAHPAPAVASGNKHLANRPAASSS